MSISDTSRLAAKMADPDQPLKPFFSHHPSDTLFLIVGEEQEQFLVHSTYLSARSEFFRAALSKNWKEGQSRVIKLPEDDPTTVAQYLDFVYKDMLPTLRGWSPDQAKVMYLALARLYVYGERVLDVVIRNVIVEHFISFSSIANRELLPHPYYPGPDVVELVYEGTTAASPMRKLLVDMYVRHGSKEWLAPESHAGFCQDVARELMGTLGQAIVARSGATIRTEDYLVE
jgi:hypothetical protein